METQDMEKDFMSFINSHSFKDRKEVYTNGAELVPVFRVQQAYDYYFLKLEKALDKACEILEARDIEKSDKEGTKINLKHWWKEDLMNNEVIDDVD